MTPQSSCFGILDESGASTYLNEIVKVFEGKIQFGARLMIDQRSDNSKNDNNH